MPDPKRQHTILVAAERLIIHYGISKTTISDIAKEARIGVGTVYLEFSSKDDIVARIAHERHQTILDSMREAADANLQFDNKFKAMMDARVRAFIEHAGPGAHAADLIHCGCEAIEQEFAAFRDTEARLIADTLAAGIQAGQFQRHLEVETLARSVIHAYHVFTPPTLFNQTFDSLFGELDAMHKLVLSGLKVPEFDF